MVKRAPLSEAEVAAVFAGTFDYSTHVTRTSSRKRPYEPRYSRCSNCGIEQVGLWSFIGDTDWSPELPVEDRLRVLVRDLRASTGKRVINLCGECVEHHRGPIAEAVATTPHPRLFD